MGAMALSELLYGFLDREEAMSTIQNSGSSRFQQQPSFISFQ